MSLYFNTPLLQPTNMHSIRVETPIRNTLVISGSPQDSSSGSLLEGHVVFALSKPTLISCVKLTLLGTLNIDFVESYRTSTGQILSTCPYTSSTTVYSHFWTNLLTSPIGSDRDFDDATNNIHGQQRATTCPLPNFNNLQTYHYTNDIPLGVTPFSKDSTLTSLSSDSVFELPAGNYSLPFKVTIPQGTPESLESLKPANIVYMLQSSIVPYNDIPLKTSKYLRIIRSLSTLELVRNEEFLAENSWPGKLQYKIRIPRKGVSLGSTLKVNILVIPITKGLKLGKISFQVVQYLKMKIDRDINEEKVVYHQSMPPIPQYQLSNDIWALEAKLPLPKSITKISPDFGCKTISIKHRLLLFINLVNPDGHVSQIKSKIPLSFHIDPDIPIFAKTPRIDNEGNVEFMKEKTLLFADAGEAPLMDQEPELFICPIDDMNPESFLFNDDPYSLAHDQRKDVPPTYTDSLKDMIFDPKSPTSSPHLSSTSLMELGLTEEAPQYGSVFDDDSSVGEPTPIYVPKDTSRSLPASRSSTPIQIAKSNSLLHLSRLSHGYGSFRSKLSMHQNRSDIDSQEMLDV